jgi:hypothetical protein
VHCVTSGQLPISEDDLFGSLDYCLINSQHLVHYAKQGVESRLNGIAAINGNVTMQNFLQDLGIRYQTLTLKS